MRSALSEVLTVCFFMDSRCATTSSAPVRCALFIPAVLASSGIISGFTAWSGS